MHRSMNLYVKAISKRNEAEDREKSLPIGYLGRIMLNHGEDFESDSEFGQSLMGTLPTLHAGIEAKYLQVLVVLRRELHAFRRRTWSM